MRGGPTPSAGRAPDPVATWLFRVSYRTRRGETFSKLFRREASARLFAQRVRDYGGTARLHRGRITAWEEAGV